MKKFIILSLALLAGYCSLAQPLVTNVIKYSIDENGKVILDLEGPGYLYKPAQESAYYLYSNADWVYFDFGDNQSSNNKFIVLPDVDKNNKEKGGFWPFKDVPDGSKMPCKASDQDFITYGKYNIALFRASTRPKSIVKDELLIDGQKVYIWAPTRGTVDLTVNDVTFSQDTTIKADKGAAIRIQANKHGSGAILEKILVSGENGTEDLGYAFQGGPRDGLHDAFDASDVSLFAKRDTTITSKTKPFDIILVYKYLDGEYYLRPATITVHVDIDNGLRLGLWISLVSLGGVLFVLIVTLLAIRSGRKNREKKKKGVNREPVAGILINTKSNKGKEDWQWYPEEDNTSLALVNSIDLETVTDIVLVTSQEKKTKQAWEKNKKENIHVVANVPYSAIREAIKKLPGRRHALAQLIGQYSTEKNQFGLWFYQPGGKKHVHFIGFPLTQAEETKADEKVEALNDGERKKPEERPASTNNKIDAVPSEIKTNSTEKTEVKPETEDKGGLEKQVTALTALLEQKDHELIGKNDELKSIATKVKELESIISANDEEKKAKQKEIDDAAIKIHALQKENSESEQKLKELSDSIEIKKNELEIERKEHERTRAERDRAAADADAKILVVEKRCNEEIEATRKACDSQITAEKQRCSDEIHQVKDECAKRLQNWQADKNTFLAGICKPVERLYQISDDISRELEDSAKSFTEYMDYIVSNLSEFSERVQNKSGDNGEWRNSTNAEAEKAIRNELVDLIRNNSSWINAIARLYCYSRVKEIGQSFEENGMKVADLDSVYRDMVSLLGRYGITVIVPRILVDYYDDISKKYFGFNNEDNAISRFVSRGVLIQNQDTLKIYDMGRIAYYLDGQITKGEIVHF